jgi:MYXO-CTERM domain-containing protein
MRSLPISLFLKTLTASVLCAGIGAVGLPSRASACSAPCFRSDPFPATGSVPANALQFLLEGRFAPSGTDVTSDAGLAFDSFRIFLAANDAGASETANDAGASEIEVELVSEDLGQGLHRFTINEPIPAGTELHLEHTQVSCNGTTSERKRSTVSTLAAAPAPTQLGTLEIQLHEGLLLLANGSASCADNYHSAYADLSVVLAGSAIPYADVLRYSILVDGEVFDQDAFNISADDRWLTPSLGGGPLGRGVGRIYTTCETTHTASGTHSLTPGKHQVQMVADLPDGTRLATGKHEVTLAPAHCPVPDAGDSAPQTGGSGSVDAGDAAADTGLSAVDSSSTPALPDAQISTIRDAAVQPDVQPATTRDAAPEPDAQPSVSSAGDAASQAAAPGAAHVSKSGCSVTHTAGSTPGGVWSWALAAGLVWTRRRQAR